MYILITGITGLLGTALVEENRNRNRIKGIYIGNYEMLNSESINYNICDVTNKNEILENFREDKIECIIHAAGIAETDTCEREPDVAYRSNVMGTKNIIELANLKRAKLIYISSNAVFDGKNPPYSEEDRTNPINRYGAIKLECESLIKKNIKNYLIVRPILMYGLNNPHERKCFHMKILEKIIAGERIKVVNDVFENPLITNQCADIIWRLISKDATGLYHVAGKDVLSRYEATKIMAEIFSLDSTLINSVSSDFFSDIALRPKDTSYRTKKIEMELGIQPLGFKEGVSLLRNKILVNN